MIIKYTKTLSSAIYQDAVMIRTSVFIEEQGVSKDLEIDKFEADCIHFVLYSDQNEPLATWRLLPLSKKDLKLQRMAVIKTARKQYLGEKIMEKAEKIAKELGYQQISLSAQTSAKGFYQKMGYQKQGELFFDAGIEHILMTKKL